MKNLFKGWSDWMVIIFFTTLLVLIPLMESLIEKEHLSIPDHQAVVMPRNFETIHYHGHEENKQKPELAIAKPAIVGTASLPSTSFFPIYTTTSKYGLILSNVSLPSVGTIQS